MCAFVKVHYLKDFCAVCACFFFFGHLLLVTEVFEQSLAAADNLFKGL